MADTNETTETAAAVFGTQRERKPLPLGMLTGTPLASLVPTLQKMEATASTGESVSATNDEEFVTLCIRLIALGESSLTQNATLWKSLLGAAFTPTFISDSNKRSAIIPMAVGFQRLKGQLPEGWFARPSGREGSILLPHTRKSVFGTMTYVIHPGADRVNALKAAADAGGADLPRWGKAYLNALLASHTEVGPFLADLEKAKSAIADWGKTEDAKELTGAGSNDGAILLVKGTNEFAKALKVAPQNPGHRETALAALEQAKALIEALSAAYAATEATETAAAVASVASA